MRKEQTSEKWKLSSISKEKEYEECSIVDFFSLGKDLAGLPGALKGNPGNQHDLCL